MDNFCYGPCDWETYLWHWTDWFVRIDIVPLALMLLYVLVIGGRGFFLNYFGRRQSRLFLNETDAAMRGGAFDMVISIARRYPRNPLAKVALAGLQASVPLLPTLTSTGISDVCANAFQRSRREAVRAMNFGMYPVRAISCSAPLLGLAGTCFGLLDAFRGAVMEHHAYLAMTTSLAAYALIPAAAGLIVATPAVAVYNLLQTSLDNWNSEMLAFSLNAVSLVAARALPTGESQRDSCGYTTFLKPKFPLQRRFSELLGATLATAFALVIVAWTPLANPYLSKGLEIRLGAPERAATSLLTIELMEQTDASSRIVYLNTKKTRLEELGALLQEQRGAAACVRAQSSVPWADVVGAIDAAEGSGREVFLLTNKGSKTHKQQRTAIACGILDSRLLYTGNDARYSMFIDEATIRIKAGDGGNGCLAFRREKFVPRGGPSGGDGGKGGDVIMESSERHNTLVHFRFNPEYKAQRGRHGEGSNKTGREGEDVVLKVPVGTIVYDADSGEVVHDFSSPDDRLVIARGGRGGRGNAQFKTSVHQAPREHEDGRPGEERTLRLELKLLADVGLVGYPNAGKSTLISRISAARPKIADYPFTTLEPNLGVVAVGDAAHEISFLVADIPGLIEGAHEGAGLGTQFLRHIERTRLLVHLVDVSDASGRPDPVKDFEVIMGELGSFGAGLENKPMIVAASKIDVANKTKLAKLKRYAKSHDLDFFAISAVTGEGIDKLKYAMAEKVEEVRHAGSEVSA